MVFFYTSAYDLRVSVMTLLLQYDPQLFTDIMHEWTSADPSIAPLFLECLSQPSTSESNSQMLSVGTQEISRPKRAMNFVQKSLRHLTGKGEQCCI